MPTSGCPKRPTRRTVQPPSSPAQWAGGKEDCMVKNMSTFNRGGTGANRGGTGTARTGTGGGENENEGEYRRRRKRRPQAAAGGVAAGGARSTMRRMVPVGPPKTVSLPSVLTVAELAEALRSTPIAVIKELMNRKIM